MSRPPLVMALYKETNSEWRERAACRNMPPAVFFPEGRSGDTTAFVARAKRVCAGCSVVAPCRDYALAKGIDTGVWGGMSAEELRRERRLRRLRVVG